MEIKIGTKVQVSFVSESSTEFSGKLFGGVGIVDLIEDNRVFGKLLNGTPFMCAVSDVSVYVENLSPDEQQFQEAYLSLGGKQSDLEKEDGEYTHSKSQMAWEMWKLGKVVPDGFVLMPKSDVRTWYQDSDEPENFCNSESDLDYLGDFLDDDDVMIVNIHTSAHLDTRKVFGVWKSNSPTDIQSKFVLVDSLEDAEEIIASNKAMIEAQDQSNAK